MPTYVYECAKCGDEFELWQSFAEDPLKKHPDCGGKVTKVLQPVGIVLKGSGFYKNDSRSGSRNGRPKKSENGGERSGDKSTAAGADAGSGGGAGDSGSSSTKADSTTKSDRGSKAAPEKKPSTPASKST
jgi:putative FmdB family regulatory protein